MKKKLSYKDVLFKKKRIVATCLIVAFGVGMVYVSSENGEIPLHDGEVLVDSLNVNEETATENGDGEEMSAAEGQSFEQQRAALELERNKLLSNLDETINSTESEDEKANASAEKERIMGYMEQELAVEQIISSKSLPASLVIITESSVNVTVDEENLDTVTVAKICDIVIRETGRTADKIIVQSLY